MAIEAMKRWQQKKLSEGYKRIPSGLLSPEVASALDKLMANEYETSKGRAINKAIKEAYERNK